MQPLWTLFAAWFKQTKYKTFWENQAKLEHGLYAIKKLLVILLGELICIVVLYLKCPYPLEIHTKIIKGEIIWCLGFTLKYSGKKGKQSCWGGNR